MDSLLQRIKNGLKVFKIAYAGTDGRTLLGALITETAKSDTDKSGRKYKGFVIRGTPAMPLFVKMMKWPVKFIETLSSLVEDYVTATIKALEKDLIDIVIPMPEALQFGDFVGKLMKAGFGDNVIGLTKAGAILESHKIKCKKILRRAGIPVAKEWERVNAKNYYEVLNICLKYIRKYGGVVLKYPFSAGGKGASVITCAWQIKEVYDQIMKDYDEDYTKMFGKKRNKKRGWPLLIESLMSGFEISFTIFVDKNGHFQILPTAMDYPERFDRPPSKENPITGGMYAVSPHPFETPELLEMAADVIARPLIEEMKRMKILRPCILYPGCFANFDAEGKPLDLRVSEINIRWGEPEAQPVMRRVRNMGAMIVAMIEGNLHEVPPEVRTNQLAFCAAYVTGKGGPDGQKGYPWGVTKKEPVVIDFKYMKRKGIQIIPSAMEVVKPEDEDWKQSFDFLSDGTRVAFGNINVEKRENETLENAAKRGRRTLKLALENNKIRIIPREDREKEDGSNLNISMGTDQFFEVEQREKESPEQAIERGRNALKLALEKNKIRVSLHKKQGGNRLDMRKKAGNCFEKKKEIFLEAA